MKKKCLICGDEHECVRETCRECGGYGFLNRYEQSTTGGSVCSKGCNRCGGTGYEPKVQEALA